MEELFNPIDIILWIFNFVNGFIQIMNYKVDIPGIGNYSLWNLIAVALPIVIGLIIIKRVVPLTWF